MAGEVSEENFINMDDDFEGYVKYLHLLFTDYYELVEKLDNVVEKNVFSQEVYVEVSGIIKYASKRVFPLLLTFFSHDDNFDEDIYPEFMDIQLMVLYLFDKLQYEMDEQMLKWNVNDVVIYEEIINLESINYLFKLILPQLLLFVKVFDTKIENIEGKIGDEEFEQKMIEVHDSIFF